MTNVTFPRAPLEFDTREEQVFRDLARKGITDSVSRSSMFNPITNQPLFFGQPHAQALGTDSALVVVASTTTYLPLPNIIMSHVNLVNSGEFKTKYAMDVEIQASVYHPSPGGAARNALYELYFSRWDGSSYISEILVGAITMDFSSAWTLNFSGMIASLGANFMRLRLKHNDIADNVFDLTKSWMSIKQLSLEPAIGETRT